MIREVIELVAQGIEGLAVLIILGGIIYGIGRYFFHHISFTKGNRLVTLTNDSKIRLEKPCCWAGISGCSGYHQNGCT